MANTFINTSQVILDSALVLADNSVAANLVNRNHEEEFVPNKGTTVKIKGIADLGAASEFSTTTSATALTETSVDLTLDKHFYMRLDLTSEQMRLDIEELQAQVINPAVLSVVESIDSYFIARIQGGFAPELTGTAGTAPSTVEDIILGRKTIKDNRAPMNNLVGLIGTTAEASFLQLNQFTSADYGVDRPMALREASLGRLHQINWFTDQNVGTSDQGDVAGTVLLNGAGTAGDATVGMDAFTAATGTIKEGTRFTIAGTATVYTVTADTAIAGNAAAAIPITPVLSANETDNDAITFLTAHTSDVIYNPMGVAGAIIPPMPMAGTDSSIMSVNGMGLRITLDGSTSTLATSLVIDTLAGCKVTNSKFGTVFQA